MAVIVIDPFSSGSEYLPQLRKAGLTTYVLQTSESANAGLAAGRNDDYLQYEEDFAGDFCRLYRWALEKNIHSVLAGAESGVPLAEALKYSLGQKVDPDVLDGQCVGLLEKQSGRRAVSPFDREVSTRYDKYAMLRAAREAGVPVGRFLAVDGLDPLSLDRYTTIFGEEEKVIIKPSISAGSVDVTAAQGYRQVVAKVSELIPKKNLFGYSDVPILIQEFHQGKEFIVDTVSYAKEHQVVAVSTYDKHPAESGHIIYDRIVWIAEEHGAYDTVVNYAQDILRALDHSDGCAHMEIMLTDRGPFLIDIGFRPHGAGHPMRTYELTGNSQIHQEVKNALLREGEIRDGKSESGSEGIAPTGVSPYMLRAHGSIEFFSLDAPATAAAFFDAGPIRAIPQVRDFSYHLVENKEYPATRTLLDSLDLGMCFLVGSSPEEVRRVGDEVRALFQGFFI